MSGEGAALTLAEKVLAILELGSFSATYKYALFTAILDLCLERTSATGDPPSVLTTAELARKVVEIYWPHATPYDGKAVLRQGGVREGTQAEIVRTIERFRSRHAGEASDLLNRARGSHSEAWRRLEQEVEWKLIEMPIPRLQVSGGGEDRFLYEYGWTQAIRRSVVTAYQRGEAPRFDNRLLLRPGVAEGLLLLNGILRPILRREWASMVAAMNGIPESRLEDFLFGSSRIPLGEVRGPLTELQGGRCFYCKDAFRGAPDVDHFIPWVRYPDNGLDNLVATHARCNNRKRDFLAAAGHVERWAIRNVERTEEIAHAAKQLTWERDPVRSRAVAVATYSRLDDGAKVWLEGASLVGLEKARVERALASWV